MEKLNTQRGFVLVRHPAYPNGEPSRLVQESSAVGEYHDAMDKPGSSFLWIGKEHHLNREEVAELIHHLTWWLKSGRLA